MKLFALLLLCGVASATNYYVAKDGSNDNPGTEELPWLTIQKGVDNATSPGDTCWVKAGTYNEVVGWGPGDPSGTAEAPIVFKSYTDTTAIITNAGLHTHTLVIYSADYITLDGFRIVSAVAGLKAVVVSGQHTTFKNCDITGTSGVATSSTVYISALGVGFTMTGCQVHLAGGGAYSFTSHGIYNNADSTVLTYNIFYDNGGYGIQYQDESAFLPKNYGICAYNIVRDNLCGGIYVQFHNQWIHHNLIYKNLKGVKFGGTPASGVTIFENNTLFGDSVYEMNKDNADTVVVRNNIFAYSRTGNLAYMGSLAGIVEMNYNCYYPDDESAFVWSGHGGTFAEFLASTSLDTNSVCQNPYLTDTAADNFRLTDSSPCIGAGDPTTTNELDLDTTYFADTADIGAYWYAGLANIGAISFASTPEGAAIAVDGVGTDSVTPCVIDSLATGSHTVLLTLAGYFDGDTTVTIATLNDTAVVDMTLIAGVDSGSIVVTSTPSGAIILNDGYYAGTTPDTLSGQPIGDHIVGWMLSGYESYTDTVTVTKNGVVATTKALTRRHTGVGGISVGGVTGAKLKVGAKDHGRVRVLRVRQ